MSGAQGSQIFGALLGDAEIAAEFSDPAQIRAMLNVETALARAQAALGIIPADAAADIGRAATALAIEPGALANATCEAGVPVIALVAQLRAATGDRSADFVHWGATSQDIMDSALMLNLRAVLAIVETRMEALILRLAALAREHRDAVMAGRTRSQHAVPTTFGAKAAGWIVPLLRHRQRLGELRPRLLVAQLGGAAGTLAPFGDNGLHLLETFADELGLGRPLMPWHGQRDSLVEAAGWFAALNAILGKTGQDLVLLAQTEVAEIRIGDGSGSSTMPQKSNPVLAEALVSLARYSSGLVGTMYGAAVHAHERDGAAWSTEWLVLPQAAEAAGTSLRHGLAIGDALKVDRGRMRANLEAAAGTIMAEAASFVLAAYMPRQDARSLVERGCRECLERGESLADWLRANGPREVDWEVTVAPQNWLGSAGEMVDRVCAEVDMMGEGDAGFQER